MRAIQYVTTQSFQRRPYELFPCGSSVTGALPLTIESTPEQREVLGFGVALTASSC